MLRFMLILSVLSLFILVASNHNLVNAQSCIAASRWGDVNMDGIVDDADALKLQSMVNSHVTLSEYYPLANLYHGAMDSDFLDNEDLVTLQMLLAGRISNTSLPISSGLPYPVPHFIRYGDLNGDGIVNVTDLSFLANVLAGNITPTVDQRAAADVLYNGTVNVSDLSVMANFLAGNIHILPVVPQ